MRSAAITGPKTKKPHSPVTCLKLHNNLYLPEGRSTAKNSSLLPWTDREEPGIIEIMSEPLQELTEDEIIEAVAAALSQRGLVAGSQNTGGGINCIVLEHKDGGEIIWGTADVTWGAVITNADGEQFSSIETTCPSGSQDVAAIAKALLGPSLRNGAVLSHT
jgi:hypothetical protein